MQDEFLQSLAARLDNAPSCPEGRFEGRGIVTCAGGTRYFTCVWVLIRVLRQVVGSTLPIQVWHLGRGEISPGMRVLLEELDAEVVDAETVIAEHPARIAGGWPLKPYAIAHSRFREVLFLDADTVPFRDPACVFEWDEFSRTGQLFWPDVVRITEQNPIWRLAGLTPREITSFESGILAVDKARTWDMLDTAVFLNEQWQTTYQGLYGDKDTFLLANLLRDRAYGLIDQLPHEIDSGLVQRRPDGAPLIEHRTSAKWNLHGPNWTSTSCAYGEACLAALEELRRRWPGTVFHPPEQTERALQAEQELARIGRFSYSTNGEEPRLLVLGAGNRIEEGRKAFEHHWCVIERKGRLFLQFYSDTMHTVELERDAFGVWQGAAVAGPGFDARLTTEQNYDAERFSSSPRQRSAQQAMAGLVDETHFAHGFDDLLCRRLGEALRLFNTTFDDVPECIETFLKASGRRLDPRWMEILGGLAAELSHARDERRQLAELADTRIVGLNPNHYDRA